MPAKIPRRLKVINAYKELFKTPAGKTVLHDMMGRFHIVGSTFDPSPNISAHMEGQREVVLHILNLMGYDDKQLQAEIEESYRQEENVE